MTAASIPDDLLPPCYGKLSDTPEAPSALAPTGWSDFQWLHRVDYSTVCERSRGRLLVRIPPLATDATHSGEDMFHRRQCDAATLMAVAAAKFEEHHPKYFKYPYTVQSRDVALTADDVAKILEQTFEELCDATYLFPFAAVAQSARPMHVTPFVMRAWWFVDGPKAMVKRNRMRIDDSIETTGACVVCQPPTQSQLHADPTSLFRYRTVVGHEIAHYCLDHADKIVPDLPAKLSREELPENELEQAASLLAIFLAMYRGCHLRRALTAHELDEAFDSLDCETSEVRHHRGLIIDSIAQHVSVRSYNTSNTGNGRYPCYFDETQRVSRLDTMVADDDDTVERCTLGDKQILALRMVARALIESTQAITLAPFAYAVMARKIDSFLSFRRVDPEVNNDIRWTVSDRTGVPKGKGARLTSQWREFEISVPAEAGKRLTPGESMKLARHIAHIRLHGGRYGDSGTPKTSGELLTKCTPVDRDSARIMALAIHAYTGKRTTDEFSLHDARRLLLEDHAGLRELAGSAPKYFYWCTADPDCPSAYERFRGRITGRDPQRAIVGVNLWKEDERETTVFLPLSAFEGFVDEEIVEGRVIKLFGVKRNGSNELRAFPVKC